MARRRQSVVTGTPVPVAPPAPVVVLPTEVVVAATVEASPPSDLAPDAKPLGFEDGNYTSRTRRELSTVSKSLRREPRHTSRHEAHPVRGGQPCLNRRATDLTGLQRSCCGERNLPTMVAGSLRRHRSCGSIPRFDAHSLECYRSLDTGPVFYKFGRHVRYAVADLDAWAESCRRSTSATRQPVDAPR